MDGAALVVSTTRTATTEKRPDLWRTYNPMDALATEILSAMLGHGNTPDATRGGSFRVGPAIDVKGLEIRSRVRARKKTTTCMHTCMHTHMHACPLPPPGVTSQLQALHAH